MNVLLTLRFFRDHHQDVDLGRDDNDRSFREEVSRLDFLLTNIVEEVMDKIMRVKLSSEVEVLLWMKQIFGLDEMMRIWKFPESIIPLWWFSITGLVVVLR